MDLRVFSLGKNLCHQQEHTGDIRKKILMIYAKKVLLL